MPGKLTEMMQFRVSKSEKQKFFEKAEEDQKRTSDMLRAFVRKKIKG